MENNKSKKRTAEELFAPYADDSEKMTAEEVEKFMKEWPQIIEELEKGAKE